jgi:hypothetical protein
MQVSDYIAIAAVAVAAASFLVTLLERKARAERDRRALLDVTVTCRLVRQAHDGRSDSYWWRLTLAGGAPTSTASVSLDAWDSAGRRIPGCWTDLPLVVLIHGQVVHLPGPVLSFADRLPLKVVLSRTVNSVSHEQTALLYPEPY